MTHGALRQAIWWLAYATSIPNPLSDIISEGLGRGWVCYLHQPQNNIFYQSFLQLPDISSFLTLPDNQFSSDGEMLLDSICDAHHF